MCFRTAEAQQGERSRALNAGIITLLIPPLVLLAGIIWLAWRRDRQRARMTKAGDPLSPRSGSGLTRISCP
jgi:hypothetical protein